MQESEHTGARTPVSDVENPYIDPSYDSDTTEPHGWHDDLMTAMAAESPTSRSRGAVAHMTMTPFRERMKLLAAGTRRRHEGGGTFTPPTVIASTSPSIFDYDKVKTERARSSIDQPASARPRDKEDHTSPSGKRTWGEAIYRVGYEREVLDTEARLHSTMYDLFGSHVNAKLDKPPRRALDIGTGLGLWPIAQSQIWPETRFVGLDRVPSQLDLRVLRKRWKVGNVSWIQSDFLEPLPFKDDCFGYIHLRFIGLGIPEHHWPSLLEESLRVLEPGGKIEIVETSYDLPLSPASLQNSFASLLLSDLVAESPAHAINFALPMLEGIIPSSIHPTYSETFTSPPGALRDAAVAWISTSLDYKVSCRLEGGTLAQVKEELGWSTAKGMTEDQPVRLWVWVIEKAGKHT